MPTFFSRPSLSVRRLGALPLLLLLGLAACDSGAAPATVAPTAGPPLAGSAVTPAANTGAAATSVVNATLLEWSITLSQASVPAGAVHFTVTNGGIMPHNFTVEGADGVVGKTATFAASEGPQTLDVTLAPGTYTLICSLPGHAQRGQQATLTVK